ncbi:MAG: hypothetical protein K0R23_204 [Lacrimispora sp.]|nr:hypothetical protein [Lacrimispora sp.]
MVNPSDIREKERKAAYKRNIAQWQSTLQREDPGSNPGVPIGFHNYLKKIITGQSGTVYDGVIGNHFPQVHNQPASCSYFDFLFLTPVLVNALMGVFVIKISQIGR